MNHMISFPPISINNDSSWSTALGYINEISNQSETHKILDLVWKLIRALGASGCAYFLPSHSNKFENSSDVKVYQYGTAFQKSSEMRHKYKQVSEANETNIEIEAADDRKGSIISIPVFGPYNSKAIFIIHSWKSPDLIHATEIEKLNYVLLKTQIYIAGIEAKQKLDSVALSKREIQVLEQLIKGKSNKEIAHILGVSVHTVNGYVRFLMLKLDVKDRVSACMAGLSILQ
ncbi:MAG: LuxR family transcriptional regulator [Acidimicrobiales bacterium]|nr:helix-turn-helix transcriptional regulator [Hyphomonadaceae bacterium]RZV42687.1 MAG: LuxR family transcriptional regulator [Acidimicrobiales bacterium]